MSYFSLLEVFQRKNRHLTLRLVFCFFLIQTDEPEFKNASVSVGPTLQLMPPGSVALVPRSFDGSSEPTTPIQESDIGGVSVSSGGPSSIVVVQQHQQQYRLRSPAPQEQEQKQQQPMNFNASSSPKRQGKNRVSIPRRSTNESNGSNGFRGTLLRQRAGSAEPKVQGFRGRLTPSTLEVKRGKGDQFRLSHRRGNT